jgi:DNA polymerase III subunit epsilon
MYAIVDLETTGGIPDHESIIEMAVLLHDGARITGSYTTLINPGKEIPPFISRLTGITDEMVASAPMFRDIADEVATLLENRVFVAHNVMFDYSFLTYQLELSGYKLEHKLFCTCHSGRKLLPGHPSYSLGKLCRSLGIPLNGAHRAEADARATASLLELMLQKTGGNLEGFLQDRFKRVNQSKIPDEQLNLLPPRPGVLYFRNDENDVIFLTAAKSLRKKAWALISRFKNNRFAALAKASSALDFQVTGGEIMAAIIECQELSLLSPRLNRKSLLREKRYSVYSTLNDQGYLELRTGPYDLNAHPIVTFHSSAEANRALKSAMKETGLQLFSKDHLQTQLLESCDTYNEIAGQTIKILEAKRKNFIITEKGLNPNETTAFVVVDARYRGYVLLDADETMVSPEQLLERLKPEEDAPGVMNSISRLVGKGTYLKLVHIP